MGRIQRAGFAVNVVSLWVACCLTAHAMASGIKFDIAAGTATAALKQFAAQAHVQLLFDYKAVQALKTPAVRGELEPGEALKILLQGSGLSFKQVNDHTIAVVAEGADAPSSWVMTGDGAAQASASSSSQPVHQTQAEPGSAPSAIVVPFSDKSADKLEEVVVNARRRTENLQDTPISVSAMTSDVIERLNVSRPDQLTGFVPNVQIQQSYNPGSSQIFIRGIGEADTDAVSDSSNSLYVDEVYRPRMNSNALELGDIDHIEVLRGPQGTLFGRNTVGGAISIFTHKPTDTFGFEQKLLYGSDNEIIARSILNTGSLGESDIRVKLTYFHNQRDAYVDDPNASASRSPGAYFSDSFAVRATAPLTQKGSVDYSFDYNTTESVPAAAQITAATADFITYFGASPTFGGDPLQVSPDRLHSVYQHSADYSHERRIDNALTLKYDFSDAAALKAITAAGETHRNIQGLPLGGGNFQGVTVDPVSGAISVAGVTPFFTNQDIRTDTSFSEEIQLAGTVSRLKYVVGFFYFKEKLDLYSTDEFAFVLPGGEAALNLSDVNGSIAHNSSTAGFAQLSFTPPWAAEKLELAAGVRYTRDKRELMQKSDDSSQSVSYSNTSGEGSVRYKWTPDVMGYARVASAYKAGGFNNLVSGLDIPNSFAPATAVSYELGIKSQWLDERIRLDFDVFHTDYKNIQISNFVTGSGGFAAAIYNAAKAKYDGAEVELTTASLNGWRFDANLGYLRPRYEQYDYTDPATNEIINVADQAHFPFTSDLTTHIGVERSFGSYSFGDLSARVDYNYLSGRYFFPLDLTAPFNQSIKPGPRRDLSARIILADMKWGGVNLNWSVIGENLLNQDYRINGIDFSSLGYGTNYYARPRSYGIEVTGRL